MAITINAEQLEEFIRRCFSHKRVPYVEGQPGIGKSQVFEQIAKKYNLKVIYVPLAQYDVTELNGFPKVGDDIASYIPMETFPLQNAKLPKGYDGWLLFLDELSNAEPPLMKAAYKLILDRMIGNKKLHEDVYVAAAGNRVEDNSMVSEIPMAMRSRMIHCTFEADPKRWIGWGLKNDIDHRLIAFIRFRPEHLNSFDPDSSEPTYSCPRTLEFLSDFIKDTEVTRDDLPIMAGTISHSVASEFLIHTQIYDKLVTIPQIVNDPINVQIPEEPSLLFALIGNISNNIDASNIKELLDFVSRLSGEFKTLCGRDIAKIKPALITHSAFTAWSSKLAMDIYGSD